MPIVHKNCRIAYGVTRTVFLLFNIAIKIPSFYSWRLFLLGLLANMQEAKFSKLGWPELCPVLFSLPGGFCVIMRRAKKLTEEEYHNFDFDSYVNKNNYTIPVENKRCSFGIINGEIVAVDYGN